jgi:pimeloyl-ACP methyl ester carboxylesterase
MGQPTFETIEVRGLKIEILKKGSGPSLLFLHPHLGFWKSESFIEALAKRYSVIAPLHPGFGNSAVAPWLTTVDDLSYFYLDLLERLNLRDVTIVGASLGGWISLAVAIKDCERIDNLVLINSTGVHFRGAEEEDIGDIFSMSEQEFASRAFSQEAIGRKDYAAMTDGELLLSARNREAAARYAWMPCFYDPKLVQRLHRVRCRTLVLWGEDDRITSSGYGQRLGAALPNATYESISGAGHFPHIEKPAAAADRIFKFSSSMKGSPGGAVKGSAAALANL